MRASPPSSSAASSTRSGTGSSARPAPPRPPNRPAARAPRPPAPPRPDSPPAGSPPAGYAPPAGPAPGLAYANFGVRLAAYIIDIAIMGIVGFIIRAPLSGDRSGWALYGLTVAVQLVVHGT